MGVKEKIKDIKFEPTEVDAVREKIEGFLIALQDRVFGKNNPKGSFFLLPGFTTNHGLEYKAIVKIRERDYEDMFFRFYAPLEGYPVHLDMWDENLTCCNTEADLDREFSAFLDKPEVLSRLKRYSEIAPV